MKRFLIWMAVIAGVFIVFIGVGYLFIDGFADSGEFFESVFLGELIYVHIHFRDGLSHFFVGSYFEDAFFFCPEEGGDAVEDVDNLNIFHY